MQNKKYSQGVFLNILTKDAEQWKNGMDFIRSLSNVGHIEILLEYLPRNDDEIETLISLTKGYKTIIHAPFIGLSLSSSHEEINKTTSQLFLRALEIADALHSEVVTLHGGAYPFFLSEKEALNLIVENLKDIRSTYKGSAVFTIENLPRHDQAIRASCPDSLSGMARLKKLLPDINFTVDIGHTIQGGEDVSEFLKHYKNSIMDIHVHDALPDGRAHLALGEGILNLKNFFQLLIEIEYDKYLTLETISREDTKSSWISLNER